MTTETQAKLVELSQRSGRLARRSDALLERSKRLRQRAVELRRILRVAQVQSEVAVIGSLEKNRATGLSAVYSETSKWLL